MLLTPNNHQNSYQPTSPSIEAVQGTIWSCLNNYAYEDAIFLAERLLAEGGEESLAQESSSSSRLHLLATSYYRSNNKLQCYDLLRTAYKSCVNLSYKCKFLLATVAMDLNKLSESEKVLLSGCNGKAGTTIDQLERSYNEISSFALKLYGKICLQTDRLAVAREAFTKSLHINPLLWDSFESICKIGQINVDPKLLFTVDNLSKEFSSENTPTTIGVQQQVQQQPLGQHHQTNNVVVVGILHPRNTTTTTTRNNNNNNNNRIGRNLFTSTPMNNQFNSNNLLTDSPQQQQHGSGGGGTSGGGVTGGFDLSPIITPADNHAIISEPRPKKPCLRTVVQSNWQQQQQLQQQQQQNSVRRSSRLFNSHTTTPPSSNNNLKENNKAVAASSSSSSSSSSSARQQQQITTTTITSSPSTITTSTVAVNKRAINRPISQQQHKDIGWLLTLLQDLGEAYLKLARYECADAITKLTTLKVNQQNTPWVLGTIAKAFFELADYDNAIRYYKRMRGLAPNRLEGLEWMSTALWHLQKEVELSVLSQDLLAENENKARAETWIVVGNCFSIQKEHEQAIKFFKRAIQVNSKKAYSYTLLGHEYVTTEELEKALRCFRSASRMDPRHYNSWYGMGMIYYKQERYTQAEIYYKKAINIHPHNSVLLCHLGVVQNALSRTEKSLSTFTAALELNGDDPLCKFHRASVLFAVNRLDEALDELQELKRIVPKESLVHFLIAKIYSKKGDTHKALLHFSWATDLDPKGANNHIKESIEPVLSRSNATTTPVAMPTPNNNNNNIVNNVLIDEEEEDIESDLTL